MAVGVLLAHRLADRADAVLGEVVDARPAAGDGGPAIELTLTMSDTPRGPSSAALSSGSIAAWATYRRPCTLIATIRSHSSSGGVLGRAEEHHAGVVDHRVEPAELLDRLR